MPTAIDWAAIEKFMMLGHTFQEAEKAFGVKADTVLKRSKRKLWPLPSVVAKVAAKMKSEPAENGAIIAQSAKTLAERGEEHAKTVFDLASRELANVKRLPIRNWKDAEIADKTARRSAGMGNDDEGARISIIQLNEAIDAHKPDEEVLEAELIPGNPETSEAPLLEQGQPAQQNPNAGNEGASDT